LLGEGGGGVGGGASEEGGWASSGCLEVGREVGGGEGRKWWAYEVGGRGGRPLHAIDARRTPLLVTAVQRDGCTRGMWTVEDDIW